MIHLIEIISFIYNLHDVNIIIFIWSYFMNQLVQTAMTVNLDACAKNTTHSRRLNIIDNTLETMLMRTKDLLGLCNQCQFETNSVLVSVEKCTTDGDITVRLKGKVNLVSLTFSIDSGGVLRLNGLTSDYDAIRSAVLSLLLKNKPPIAVENLVYC